MKRPLLLSGAIAMTLTATSLQAQDLGELVSTMPVIAALDTNGDGKLSGDEIGKRASASLLTLDKNGDGKLSVSEIRPRFEDLGGAISGGPPRSFAKGNRPKPGGGFPFGGGGPFGSRPPLGDPANMVKMIMSNDKDGDGKVSENEMPIFARGMLKLADTNGDGAIDKEEGQALAAKMRKEMGDGVESKPNAKLRRPPTSGLGTRPPDVSKAPEVGEALPDIKLYDEHGDEFRLTDLKGGYSVVVFGCLT